MFQLTDAWLARCLRAAKFNKMPLYVLGMEEKDLTFIKSKASGRPHYVVHPNGTVETNL